MNEEDMDERNNYSTTWWAVVARAGMKGIARAWMRGVDRTCMRGIV
jgi:hypothetical protein